MHRPAVSQLINKNESYYSLVVAVAKRAREIANDIYDSGDILDEKPVKTAVNEFASGKCKLIEDESLRKNIKED